MRKTIAAFLIAIVGLASCREDDITGIQKRCNETDAHLGSYKHKTIDLTGITEQSGSVTGYYKGDDLVMASTATFGESGREVDEYFFDDNNIECIIKQEYIYNHPMYYTDTMAIQDGDTAEHGGYDDKKTVMKVSRFYFYDGSMVKWFDQDNKLVPDNDRKYQFQSYTLLSDADKLMKMLKM